MPISMLISIIERIPKSKTSKVWTNLKPLFGAMKNRSIVWQTGVCVQLRKTNKGIRKHYESSLKGKKTPLTSMPVNCFIASKYDIEPLFATFTCSSKMLTRFFPRVLHKQHTFFLLILVNKTDLSTEQHNFFEQNIDTKQNRRQWQACLYVRCRQTVESNVFLCWTVFVSLGWLDWQL